MPLQDSEIIWRPSHLVSDAVPAQNGGRMRIAALPTGIKNNLFPDVTRAERDAGSVRLRKAFIHIASATDTPLINARVFIDTPTPAGDYVTLHPGTQTDTESQFSSRAYGVGSLAATANAGATSLVVTLEHAAVAALEPFRANDLLRIGPAGGGTVGEQFVRVASVSYSGAQATIAITPGLLMAHAADAAVSSVIEQASIAASISDFAVTSVAGSFAHTTAGNAVARARGGVADTWTLTFTSASAFTVSGLATGSVGTGSIHTDTVPINPATSTPYFALRMAAWGGTWQAGDTLRFATAPAALPLWYRRAVPVGVSPAASNATSVTIYGESA